jgi:hypothetical protein
LPVIFWNVLPVRLQPLEIPDQLRVGDVGFAGEEEVLPDRFVMRTGRLDVKPVSVSAVLPLVTDGAQSWKGTVLLENQLSENTNLLLFSMLIVHRRKHLLF